MPRWTKMIVSAVLVMISALVYSAANRLHLATEVAASLAEAP